MPYNSVVGDLNHALVIVKNVLEQHKYLFSEQWETKVANLLLHLYTEQSIAPIYAGMILSLPMILVSNIVMQYQELWAINWTLQSQLSATYANKMTVLRLLYKKYNKGWIHFFQLFVTILLLPLKTHTNDSCP